MLTSPAVPQHRSVYRRRTGSGLRPTPTGRCGAWLDFPRRGVPMYSDTRGRVPMEFPATEGTSSTNPTTEPEQPFTSLATTRRWPGFRGPTVGRRIEPILETSVVSGCTTVSKLPRGACSGPVCERQQPTKGYRMTGVDQTHCEYTRNPGATLRSGVRGDLKEAAHSC